TGAALVVSCGFALPRPQVAAASVGASPSEGSPTSAPTAHLRLDPPPPPRRTGSSRMAPRKTAAEGVDTRGILIGGGAILSAIAISLLAAWGLIALFGGKLRGAPIAPPAITGPVLE